jgi:hypothetical protein
MVIQPDAESVSVYNRLMRYLLGLMLFSAFASGQTITASLSQAAIQAGGSSTLTLTFADASPSANVAGIEWEMNPPTGVTVGTPVIGAAGTAAGKVVTCTPGGTVPIICIEVGDGTTLNDTAFASGVLATIPLSFAATVPKGSITVTFVAFGASTAPSSQIAMMVNLVPETILSKYDLNGDGSVNASDVLIMLQEALSGTCTGQSLNVGDGKCGISDVELEIEAALGKIN